MRVLFVSSGMAFQYGGAPVSEACLVSQLSKKHSVTLWCRSDRWDLEFAKRHGVESCTDYRPWDLVLACFMSGHRLAKELESVQVVHMNGHWRWEYFFISLLCRRYQKPYVLHPRGMMLIDKRRPVLKRIFNALIGNPVVRHAKAIISLSRFETGNFETYPIKDVDISVIPNGISAPEVEKQPFDRAQISYLYMGRLEARKNLLFLVDAFAMYRKMGGKGKLSLRGPAQRGYDLEVQALIKKNQLEGIVSIDAPAYGQEKWKLLKEATAVIYPCVDEPFGRVPFEAVLSEGFPVVPNRSGGAEYLQDKIPQGVYQEGSEESLVDTLLKIEKLPLVKRNQLIDEARTWVQRELSWDLISSKVESVYQHALLQSPVTSPV